MKTKKEHIGILYFFIKDEKEKLELVMSFHVENLFMAGNMETLNKIKENIKEKFNISESRKVNNFMGFYYEWGHYAKGEYAKMTVNKYVKKLVEG